jgi:hypothetical protein
MALLPMALLAGCTSPDEDANERRLALLRDEPLVARDKDAATSPGFVVSDLLPAHRPMIMASLFEEKAQNPSEVARKQTSDAVVSLREGKWVVYLIACLAPGNAPPNPDDVVGWQYEDGWGYAAYAYKIVDGVSYSAEVTGSGRGGIARVELRLLAPHSSEPKADLFPDRPPAVEAGVGKNCLEALMPPGERTVIGTRTLMDTTGPHPAGNPKPTGRR